MSESQYAGSWIPLPFWLHPDTAMAGTELSRLISVLKIIGEAKHHLWQEEISGDFYSYCIITDYDKWDRRAEELRPLMNRLKEGSER